MVKVALARHTTMWPGFESLLLRHIKVEFVVRGLVFSSLEGSFPDAPVFPSP